MASEHRREHRAVAYCRWWCPLRCTFLVYSSTHTCPARPPSPPLWVWKRAESGSLSPQIVITHLSMTACFVFLAPKPPLPCLPSPPRSDHAVHTVPVCCVRAEVLPEYRRVEAVKTSDEPWEREKLLTNPFLVPPPGVSLDTLATAGRGGGGGGGAWGAGAAAGQPRNPFLSPAQSGDGAFGANPFATGGGRAPSNPFLSPQGSAPNPFAEGAGGGGAGAGGAVPNPFMPTVHEGGALGGDLAGRTQATRVLERRGESKGPTNGAYAGCIINNSLDRVRRRATGAISTTHTTKMIRFRKVTGLNRKPPRRAFVL